MIVIRKSDGVAVFADCDALDETGAYGASWKSPDTTSARHELVDTPMPSPWIGNGYTWNGSALVLNQYGQDNYPQPPAPVVPDSITRRQFKLALLQIDLLDDVEAVIAASSDRALHITWSEALDFERNNPFVAQMSAALGKTEPEIDALFILGATL